MDICKRLSDEFNITRGEAENVVGLLDGKTTVPFIAAYRKELTGSLGIDKIMELSLKYEYYKKLDVLRKNVLDDVRQRGKSNAEFEKRIENAIERAEIEYYYHPYKDKGETLASLARAAGLEPLADYLITTKEAVHPLVKAEEFVCAEKGYDTPKKALEGALNIISERNSEDVELLEVLKGFIIKTGFLECFKTPETVEPHPKYVHYYNLRKRAAYVKYYHLTVIFRGVRENALTASIDMDAGYAKFYIKDKLTRANNRITKRYLKHAAWHSYKKLIYPEMERYMFEVMREVAELDEFNTLCRNLEDILMVGPYGRKPVIGVCPGFTSAGMIAAVGSSGELLESDYIYPSASKLMADESAVCLLAMILRTGARMIVVNANSSNRFTVSFIRKIVSGLPEDVRPECITTSDGCANSYGESEISEAEFPKSLKKFKIAVSVARRVQDPIRELVKIDPKEINMGKYQHELDQNVLEYRLHKIMTNSVNVLGVDINEATEEHLQYVSGLSRRTAHNIVERRETNGPFRNRNELKTIPGIGAKTFQMAAGFLRIRDGDNPLDNTAIHPEAYGVVESIAKSLGATVGELLGNAELLGGVDAEDFATDKFGVATVGDVVSELKTPGRDPRGDFVCVKFNEAVADVSHVKVGMILDGIVRRVMSIGAFVDVGVHIPAIIHASEMPYQYASDPHSFLKAGQAVRTRVVAVDEPEKKVSLTMRLPVGTEERAAQ